MVLHKLWWLVTLGGVLCASLHAYRALSGLGEPHPMRSGLALLISAPLWPLLAWHRRAAVDCTGACLVALALATPAWHLAYVASRFMLLDFWATAALLAAVMGALGGVVTCFRDELARLLPTSRGRGPGAGA